MTGAAVVLVFLVAVLLAGAGAVVLRQRRTYARANEVVPGVATAAPRSWAGEHSEEARLHRRLRDAVAAIRANEDEAVSDVRAVVEAEALAIDRQLIAVAALPGRLRAAPLERVTGAVAALEDLVGSLAGTGDGASADLDAAVRTARERMAAVAEARRELEALVGERLSPPGGTPAGG